MTAPADAEATTVEFATRLGERDVEDAAALLVDDDAVLDSLPEMLAGPESDAVDALDSYWCGLHGQYGAFEGVGEVTVADDGAEAAVDLAFADGSQRLDLALDGDGDVADVSFPAEYVPPEYADRDAFGERDVTVDAGDVELDGVFSVPEGEGPFPGVLLVHGAGVHDPDGTAGSTKVLKDLAWGLASDGVAVLRYEKRLREHDVPDAELTLDRIVVDDAVAALDELAAADEVDAGSVFVAGHSQGGMCTPRIAARHGGAAGVVLLDSLPDYSVDPDAEVEFMRYSFDPYGDLTDEEEEALEAQREELQRLADGDFDAEDTVMGRPGAFHESRMSFDPAGTVTDLDVPAFVAGTERVDHEHQQSLAEMSREGFEEWRAVDAADGSRFEYYEDVGHYFREGPVPHSMESLYFGGNVAGYVVADVAEWINDTADA